jgi:RNA polymerase sigma-70 factor, ECF subfamily
VRPLTRSRRAKSLSPGDVCQLPALSRANVNEPGDAVDDSELVRRALGGDRWAEAALYRSHIDDVGRLVTRLLARSHEAEDVLQEAFLTAFADLNELRKVDSFRAWVTRIAVRLVHRRFRRRRLLRSLGLDVEQDDATLLSEVDPAASPEIRAELLKLDRVLRTLPAADRIAWVLRYVEGYRVEEIAELCGCSPATAKRRIASGKRRIDEHVAVQFDEEEG